VRLGLLRPSHSIRAVFAELMCIDVAQFLHFEDLTAGLRKVFVYFVILLF